MENILMQYRNNSGCTYRTLARKINTILIKNGSDLRVSHESVEDYAKSKKIRPRYEEISDAIAQLIGCSTKEFLASLRACKKAG